MLYIGVVLDAVTFERVFMKPLCESSFFLCQMSKIDSMNARSIYSVHLKALNVFN